MSDSRVVITAQADQAIREFERLRAQATGSLQHVGELGGKLDSIKKTMGEIVAFGAAGISVGAFVGMIRGSIDALDNLNDLSKKTGVTVEDLSGLQLAAKQSGSDLESMAASMNKLSVAMGKDPAKFARLGVSAKEPLEALKQFADVFSKVESPQLRAALGAEALGKKWEGAAPALSEGGKKLGEMVERGKALAGATQEAADRADEFNDKMAEMETALAGAKTKLASEMLPGLIEVTKAVVTAYEESGKLTAAWVAIGALGAFAFTNEFSSATVKIKDLRTELEGLEMDLELSKNAPAIGWVGRMLFGNTTGVLEGKIAAAKAQIKGLQDELERPAKDAAAKGKAKADADAKAKADAEAKDAAAKAAAFIKQGEAESKAALDAKLAMQKASASKEAAMRAEALATVGELNREGLASDAQFYVAKREAVIAAGADLARIKSGEIATLRAYHAKDAAEQIAINGKIAVLGLEKNEALRASLAAADLLRKQYVYDADAPARAAQAAANDEIATVNKEVLALQEQYDSYNKLPAAITAATIAKLQAKAVALEANEGSEAEIANTNRLIAALQTKATLEGKVSAQDTGSDLTRATELLAVMSALDEVTQSASAGMAASFGKVGSAIGGMTTALSGYARTQAAVAAQQAAAIKDAKGDPVKIKAAEIKAGEAAAVAQIRQYGDMATAAKGFFKENTTGYKVMEGAEKAFRAAEMALALESMVKKLFFKEGEVAASVALNGTKLAGEAATSAASTGLAATEASAWGITAVVKALASLPFPFNLAAGAATLAAVVAVGAKLVGSIGGGAAATAPNNYEQKQKIQGTGTVLGDSSARSASIANSLKIMETNSSLELDYQNSMLGTLKNIESSLGGAAKNLLQTTGLTGGSAFGTVASKDDSFIGASHTKDITDSGVSFSGTLGALRSGQGRAQQYEDVYTTSDGGMFRSGWTNTTTNSKALSAEAMKPFAMIFDDMGKLLVDAGTKLGMDGASLTSAIDAIPISFEVSLRNLKGQDLVDALNAGVSVAFDKVTRDLFPSIEQFQKNGEGIGETLVRVATDVKAVDSVFASLGKSTAALTTTRSGWLGLTGPTITKMMEMSTEAKERLVEAVGGLEKFATSAKSFMSNFYTEEEQRAATKAKLNPVLAKVGLSTEGPNASKLFRDFVIGLDTSTAAGASTYAMLMDVQQAFKDVTSSGTDMATSAADQRKGLQDQYDELTMTAAQLHAKERATIDATNLALYDQVATQRDLKDATLAASDALKSTIDKMTSAKASALAYRDSLSMGSLSTLTPLEKYAESQRQYAEQLEKAKANPGDSAAQSGVQAAATAFLTASQVINASSAAYVADKVRIVGDMTTLADIAGAQLSDAQKQLSLAGQQVSGIATLNETAIGIQQAIADLGAPGAASAPSFDASRYMAQASAGNDALAAEIKALRSQIADLLAETKGRRGDAQQQADQLVDATEGTADVVATQVKEAVTQAGWAANNPTRREPR